MKDLCSKCEHNDNCMYAFSDLKPYCGDFQFAKWEIDNLTYKIQQAVNEYLKSGV